MTRVRSIISCRSIGKMSSTQLTVIQLYFADLWVLANINHIRPCPCPCRAHRTFVILESTLLEGEKCCRVGLGSGQRARYREVLINRMSLCRPEDSRGILCRLEACGKGVWKKHGKAASWALIGILRTPSTTEKGRKKRTGLQQKNHNKAPTYQMPER